MERSSWRFMAMFTEGIAWEPGVRQRQAARLTAALNEEPHARLPSVELGNSTVIVHLTVQATGMGSALRVGSEAIQAAAWAAPQLLGEPLRQSVWPDTEHPAPDLAEEVERLLDDPPVSERWIERTRWTREGFYPEDG